MSSSSGKKVSLSLYKALLRTSKHMCKLTKAKQKRVSRELPRLTDSLCSANKPRLIDYYLRIGCASDLHLQNEFVLDHDVMKFCIRQVYDNNRQLSNEMVINENIQDGFKILRAMNERAQDIAMRLN